MDLLTLAARSPVPPAHSAKLTWHASATPLAKLKIFRPKESIEVIPPRFPDQQQHPG
jgi:hypothetical protein